MFNNYFYARRWIMAVFSLAFALLFASVNLVSAGNVPGSATAAVPELS